MRTEYTMIPIRDKVLLKGWYLGKEFAFTVSQDDPTFRSTFYAPVTASENSVTMFHKQMMWIRGKCPSLKGADKLPEPQVQNIPIPAVVEMLHTMRLMLRNAIYDLEQGEIE